MQEELGQFEKNRVLELVPRPNSPNITGTKWTYKEIMVRMEMSLEKRYTLIDTVNLDETLSHVTLLEVIRLLLGRSCLLKFNLYQIDVKKAFLNGYLNEEVYVK